MKIEVLPALLALSVAVACTAAPVVHVPPDCAGRRLISPNAAGRNHLLVLNVAGAVPTDMWSAAVTYAAGQLQVNVWTNSIASVSVSDLVFDSKKAFSAFGPHAKVCVCLVDIPSAAPFLSQPGSWAVINVHHFKEGRIDRQTMLDRYARLILMGMAFAAGSGASVEPRCSMYCGGFTPEGIDKTGIALSPMTYFPMLERLRMIGGEEMVSLPDKAD